MNKEQEYLVGFFEGHRTKVTRSDIDGMPNLVKMWQDFKKYPYGAIVRSQVIDGEVYIVEAGETIKNIVGYTAEELKDKPLSFISAIEPDIRKTLRIVETIERLGFCPKYNVNLHKDGHHVRTQGILFKEGDNRYIELVWDENKIVKYEGR